MPRYVSKQIEFIQSFKLPPGELGNMEKQGGPHQCHTAKLQAASLGS